MYTSAPYQNINLEPHLGKLFRDGNQISHKWFLICTFLRHSQVFSVHIYVALLISEYFETHITQFGGGANLNLKQNMARHIYSVGKRQMERLPALWVPRLWIVVPLILNFCVDRKL